MRNEVSVPPTLVTVHSRPWSAYPVVIRDEVDFQNELYNFFPDELSRFSDFQISKLFQFRLLLSGTVGLFQLYPITTSGNWKFNNHSEIISIPLVVIGYSWPTSTVPDNNKWKLEI